MDRVNLFIIGVNKAGTSWLYHLLAEHPEVYMSDLKELYFFGDAQPGPATLEAYHDHFPFHEEYEYFGEATPMYYRDAAVADEIAQYNPAAQVLAIVRDPIQRLLSQYRYHKQLGLLDEETSLSAALDGRDEKLINDSHYERHLPAFANRFGPDAFTVVSLEEGREDPGALWATLQDALNLSPAPLPTSNATPENPTGSAAFRKVYRATARPIKTYAPALYQWMLQNALVRRIKMGLIQLLGTADSVSVPPDLEARLRDEFAPTYAYLRDQGFGVYDSPSSSQ